ncbi:MAG TPA: thiamine pyrophosphate-binding protein [bacterium]
MKTTVAEGLAEILHRGGVQRIYGVVGTSILPAINALGKFKNKIRYISCRHEQVAASMADAEGRITMKPGVAIVHAAPGSLNAAISAANAYKDSSPMILIAGSVPERERDRDGFLELKLSEIFDLFTFGSFRLGKAHKLADLLTHAYRKAISVPKGPVFIEIPDDLWLVETEFDENDLNFKADSVPRAKDEDVKKSKELIDRATRPLILAGAGVFHSGATQELKKFTEAYNIPVITTGNGRGTIPEDHYLSYGRSGYAGGNTVADYAFLNADLVIAIGATISDLTDYNGTWNHTGRIMVVNPHNVVAEKAKIKGFIPLICDARSFLNSMLKVPPGELIPKKDEWIKTLDIKREEWLGMLRVSLEKEGISPARVLKELRKMLPRESLFSAGAGMHLVYANDFFECYEPSTYLATNNFGSMGFGLAAAMAAKAVYPDRHAVAILGDGEFMMTLQDIETALREKLNIKVIILNDNSYRVLRLSQIMDGLEPFGTDHSNPDFIKLSESFNVKGFRLTSQDDLGTELEEFIKCDSPAILEIPTDRDDIPPTNMEAILKMRNLYKIGTKEG